MGMRARVVGAAGSLVLGVLIGYVLTTFFAPFVSDSALFGGTGETRQARDYMLGLVQSNDEMLASVTPGRDVVARAMRLQTAGKPAPFKTVSLSFVGGRTIGPITFQAYAVEVRPTSGPDRFFPLMLTLVNGKVVRSD